MNHSRRLAIADRLNGVHAAGSPRSIRCSTRTSHAPLRSKTSAGTIALAVCGGQALLRFVLLLLFSWSAQPLLAVNVPLDSTGLGYTNFRVRDVPWPGR